MADVEKNYPIDRDREFTGGYSQGGYIAYRMAMLYPHRFAGAVSWVGFTGDDANGAPEPTRGPLTYTAGGVGNVDRLRGQPPLGADGDGQRGGRLPGPRPHHAGHAAGLRRQRNPYTWYLYPAAEHLTYALVDDCAQEASDTAGLTRVRNPVEGHVPDGRVPRLTASTGSATTARTGSRASAAATTATSTST